MTDPLTTGVLVVVMLAAFYFLIVRPNRKRQAEQRRTMDSMKPGARVMLSSGIYGNLVHVGTKQVDVEIAPGVEITVLKQVVMEVITADSRYAEDTADEITDEEIEPTHEGEPLDRAEPSETMHTSETAQTSETGELDRPARRLADPDPSDESLSARDDKKA